jgi:anhydro-N-acetylmuramic acid kinase
MPYTAQIGDPNRIAARSGIATVADFRGKDIAMGGQAAPLAPAFHRFLFRASDEDRAVINIGGIANITYLPADLDLPILGFDTGPGNTLLDFWIQRHRGMAYDDGGDWARQGTIDLEILDQMITSEAYFHQPAPKSTGTEYFNPAWLSAFVDDSADAVSIQATLVELTAVTIAKAIRSLPALPRSCYLCGGGAHNYLLIERLALALPECRVTTTAELGLDADFVEAAAFAWLARERVNLRAANVPEVTRARQTTVLGGIYAAE